MEVGYTVQNCWQFLQQRHYCDQQGVTWHRHPEEQQMLGHKFPWQWQ